MRSFGLEIEGFGDLAIEVEDELSLPRLLQTKGLAGYEPAAMAVFIEALWHGPEGAVVDVGANFGKRRETQARTTLDPAPILTAAKLDRTRRFPARPRQGP
jgi:hypothetical protein